MPVIPIRNVFDFGFQRLCKLDKLWFYCVYWAKTFHVPSVFVSREWECITRYALRLLADVRGALLQMMTTQLNDHGGKGQLLCQHKHVWPRSAPCNKQDDVFQHTSLVPESRSSPITPQNRRQSGMRLRLRHFNDNRGFLGQANSWKNWLHCQFLLPLLLRLPLFDVFKRPHLVSIIKKIPWVVVHLYIKMMKSEVLKCEWSSCTGSDKGTGEMGRSEQSPDTASLNTMLLAA